MKKYFLLFFFTIDCLSSPWLSIDDDFLRLEIELLIVKCGIDSSLMGSYPVSSSQIYNRLEIKKSDSEICKIKKSELKNKILEETSTKKAYVGIQTKTDKRFIQILGNRYYSNDNIYYSTSDYHENFYYKLTWRFLEENGSMVEVFDDSFISFKLNNTIFELGKKTKWWSPSWDTSLILSNSARPSSGIEIRNFNPITPRNDFISKYLKSFNYSFFLNELEKKRDFQNASFFGHKIEFNFFNQLDISIFRTAQFGGKGRAVNLDTIKYVLSGKDTTNRDLSYDDQAGNQIAGVDVSYRPKNYRNLRIYSQYLGEDGLDPIIDDRWIGAIFPSKRFGSVGINYTLVHHLGPIIISAESITTDSNYPNVTYNHSIYFSGYRYKGRPIGASIDADSDRTNFSIQFSRKNNKYFYISFSKMKINKNNSSNNYLSDTSFKTDEFKLKFTKKFSDSVESSIIYSNRNPNYDLDKSSNNLLLDFRYYF